MFSLLFLLAQQAQAQCYLPNPSNANECYFCSHGYSQPIAIPALTTQCTQVTVDVPLVNTLYVSSSCASDCDGTNAKPFPGLIQAFKAIPFPKAGQSRPTFNILLKDEVTYIASTTLEYINRRKLVNIVVTKDPNAGFESAKIALKSQKASIVVSGTLTFNDIIFEGLGLNEKPSSPTITCTEAQQASLFNSITGISSQDAGLKCGVGNFTVQAPSLTESFGFIVLESMFDQAQLAKVVFSKCQIRNMYFVDSNPLMSSWVYISLSLPAVVEFTQTTITNCFFTNGIITNNNWAGPVSTAISAVPAVQTKFSEFKNAESVQVSFSQSTLSELNKHYVNNYVSQTGSILTLLEAPLNLQFYDVQIKNTVQVSKILDVYRERLFYQREGISVGHRNLIVYSSRTTFETGGKLVASNFLITNLYLEKVEANFFATFQPQTTRALFESQHPNNQIVFRNLTIRDTWLAKLLYFSNSDFDVDNLDFKKFIFNVLFYSDAFNGAYSYFKYVQITNSKIIDCTGFAVDDDFNELNPLIRLVNRTIKFPFFNQKVTLQTIQIENVRDIVIYDSNQFYEEYLNLLNIYVKNVTNPDTGWNVFGGWVVEQYIVRNLTFIGKGEFEQVFFPKRMPRLILFEDIMFQNINSRSFISFRTSERTQSDFVFRCNRMKFIYDEDLQPVYDGFQGFIRDDTANGVQPFSKIGAFYLQNCDITLTWLTFEFYGIFQFKYPYHVYIHNSSILSVGTHVFYYVSSNYISLVQEEFQFINSSLTKWKIYKRDVKEPLTQVQSSFLIAVNELMKVQNRKITILNSTFTERGSSFAYFTIQTPFYTVIRDCQFNNFGLNFILPNDQVIIENVNMVNTNRNSTSFFLLIDGVDTPTFISSKPPSANTAPIYIRKSTFSGSLSAGHIQLTRSKVVVEDCTFKASGQQLSGTIESLILLKQFAWLYLSNSKMEACNSNTDQKRYCIAAYSQSTFELYNTLFQDSAGSNGGFIYGYGMIGYVKSCTFNNGQAQNGGAFYLTSSTLNLLDSNFGQCKSIYSGGHFYLESSSVTIQSTKFKDSVVVDSGGSIYARNMVDLTIKNCVFDNISQGEAAIFLTAQDLSNFNLDTLNFSAIKSSGSIVLYAQNQVGVLKNSFITDISGATTNLISNIKSNLTIAALFVKDCQVDWFMTCLYANVKVNSITLVSDFFFSGILFAQHSALELTSFSVSYMETAALVQLLISKSRFTQKAPKSILISLDNTSLTLTSVNISLLTLVAITQEYQGQLLEIMQAIDSKDSRLVIHNVQFNDVFYEIEQLFESSKNVDNILDLPGKVISSRSDNLELINVSLPDFAIQVPIISTLSSSYNFTNLSYQFLSLLPQSLMQNYCHDQTCQFIDFRFNQSTGFVRNSVIKSFGVAFYIFDGATFHQQNSILSRESSAPSRAFQAISATVQLQNIYAQSFNSRSIFQNSNLQIVGGKFAFSKGIAIYGSTTTIEGVQFSNNSNNIGGAILSDCSTNMSATINIHASVFANNTAVVSGGAIRNINCKLTISQTNNFTSNSAPYGLHFLGYPAKVIVQHIIQITDQSISQLATVSQTSAAIIIQKYKESEQVIYAIGGMKLSFTLTLVDNFDQIFPVGSYFDSASFISTYLHNETSNNIEFQIDDPKVQLKLTTYLFELLRNCIIVTEMYVYAKPNYEPTNPIKVLLNGIQVGSFKLIMLQCPQGSIATDDRCFLCPVDTYSLHPTNEKCDNCADNQICFGRNFLFAAPGFYIAANTSDPIGCPVTESCLQNIVPANTLEAIYLLNFYESQVPAEYANLKKFLSPADISLKQLTVRSNCAKGYSGELCVYCEQSFGQTSDGLCYQCDQDSAIYLKFVISTVIIIGINYKDSVEPIEEPDPLDPVLSSVLFRILMDFSQISNTIVGMATSVDSDVLPVFSIFADQISIFPSDFDSGFACIFLTGIEDQIVRFKYKLLIGVLIPWVYTLLMIGIILLVDKLKLYLKEEGIPSKVTLLNIVLVCLVASLYNFYMYLTENALSIFSCLTINDATLGTKVVLSQMTDIQCWEKEHLQLIFIYGLPTLTCYVIGIPLVFIFFIQRYFQKPQNLNGSFMIGKIGQDQQSFKSDIIKDQEESSSSQISNHLNEVNYSIFLTKHLKERYKFWGVYIQIKKLLINVVIVLSVSLGINTAAIVVLVIFIIFMLISYRYSPYKESQLNRFEGLSDIIVTLIIHLTLLLIQTDSKAIQIIASVLIILFKFYFYYLVLHIISKEYLQYFRKKAKQLARSQSSKKATQFQ